MEKKYIENINLRACDCDMLGAWKPGAILTAMQETAGVHSAMCGLPRPVMDSMGIAWVLSRLKVEFDRAPMIGENIAIETYPTPNRHLFFPRSHLFIAENGDIIGRANSLWVLIDIESRRMVKGDDVAQRLPDNSDLPMAAPLPATVRATEGEIISGRITPVFTDIDMNMHVNNTKYMDWCCNALGMEIMKKKFISIFDVNYESEIRPGDMVRTELTMNDDRFSFCGFDGAKRLFAVSGKLNDR